MSSITDNIVPIIFHLPVGEIPEGAIGFLRKKFGTISFSRCFILRRFVNLTNELPCYDITVNQKNIYWSVIKNLDSDIMSELRELSDEIDQREKLYIHPSGVLITAMGIDLG